MIRNLGHFKAFLVGDLKPKYVRGPARSTDYLPCSYCKGLYKKNYLRRHYIKCAAKPSEDKQRIKHMAKSQTLLACSADRNNTLHRLRVKTEVLDCMMPDKIALVAKMDPLICYFGDNLLKKHKRKQSGVVVSNKMRELARLLIEFRIRRNDSELELIDTIEPQSFDEAVECAKKVGGYKPEEKTFSAPSVSAHLGTSLKQVADLLIRLILKQDQYVVSKTKNSEEKLKEVKRFHRLVDTQWTTEISSMAFKDLNEKRWNKPTILPLTRDIVKFKNFVTREADGAIALLKTQPNNINPLKKLISAVLVLTVLYNRRRIGDVQYTTVESYNKEYGSINQEEFLKSLTESERFLTRHYRRVVAGGKGSRPICILFPKHLQDYVTHIIAFRKTHEDSNPYLFGLPTTKTWSRADVAIRRFAKQADLEYPAAITSNKLRKHIATVMQLISLDKEETEQFSIFMGHTEKTHNEFYKYVVIYAHIAFTNFYTY